MAFGRKRTPIEKQTDRTEANKRKNKTENKNNSFNMLGIQIAKLTNVKDDSKIEEKGN